MIYLGSETSRYMFRILAIKEIMESPERYGLFLKKRFVSADSTRKVSLDTAITNLSRFAQQMKIDYNQLKLQPLAASKPFE